MHALAFAASFFLPMDPPPDPGTTLLTAFTDAIASYTPTIALIFGAAIGLTFLIGLGYFIIARVRGAL